VTRLGTIPLLWMESYCSSELIHLYSTDTKQHKCKETTLTVQTKKNKACKRWRENRPGDEETAVALKAWWLLGLCLSFFFCSIFASASCLFLSSVSPSLSLLIPALSSPVSADFTCRKIEQRRVFLVYGLAVQEKNVVSSTSSFGKIPSNFYLQSSFLF
jgi:hypothetical protein